VGDRAERKVPPLRFAPVGMTELFRYGVDPRRAVSFPTIAKKEAMKKESKSPLSFLSKISFWEALYTTFEAWLYSLGSTDATL
jgi:hypothetical protein